MTRRRNNRRKPTNLPATIAILALIILVGLIARATCDRSRDNSHGPLADSELGPLTTVISPPGHDGQTLDYGFFTVDFNPEHHQPNYATWILTRDMVQNATVSRKDNFRPDPDVEESATPADYRGSGYDRGHIVPAGDMKHDADAMDRTFFMTNMSPQVGRLNSGSWKKLEDNCRSWAVRDSALVIVAGPILTDRITRHIGRTRVSVPSRYFKVILAPYANPPRALGFIMNNGDNPGGVQPTALTVRQVEEITGYDFFSALPDDIENTVETQARYSTWQYSR